MAHLGSYKKSSTNLFNPLRFRLSLDQFTGMNRIFTDHFT